MTDEACATCGSLTEGYICEMCGETMDAPDYDHECGGEHVMPKCSGCGEAEVKCTCE